MSPGNRVPVFLIVAIVAVPVSFPASAAVVALPRTPGVESSKLFRVFADENEISVGAESSAGRSVETAAFQFDGSVKVRIIVDKHFSKCVIRPLRFKLNEQAGQKQNTELSEEVQFTLD